MYIKLAIKNMRRSLRSYVIYFITIIIVITLMHGFIVLACSPDILVLSENMVLLKQSILMITGLSSLLIGFVVGSAADFIINQRKREFAIYYLLGIEKKYINRMFYVESLVLYFFAMAIGMLFGTVLSGFLSKVILDLFDVPHKYNVSKSLYSVLFTVALGFLMQLITVFRIIASMKKKKIVDLFYDQHKNEIIEINKKKISIYLFISLMIITLSVSMIYYALTCNSVLAWMYVAFSLLFLILAIYQLYRIFPTMLASFVNEIKSWNYKGINIFLSRQIISRTNSTGRLMAVIAICLTFAMSIMAVGLAVGAGYKTQIGRYAPYDIAIKIDADISDFDMELDYIGNQVMIEDFVDYKIYEVNEFPGLSILAESDYNKIRKQLNLEPVSIEKNRYIIHCEWNYKSIIENKLKNSQEDIKIGDFIVSPMEDAIYTEVMEQRWMVGENGYAIVVADIITQTLNTEKSRLIVTAKDPVKKEIRNELTKIISLHLNPLILSGNLSKHTTIGVLVQSWTRAHSLTGYTALSFSSIYMGITFSLLVCILLGFQQLETAEKNKQKYNILWKLGLSSKDINSLILKEMLIYFSVPLVMPLIITILLMAILNKIFMEQMAKANLIPYYFILAIAVFMLVYVIYFSITFIIYRKATLPRHLIRSIGR